MGSLDAKLQRLENTSASITTCSKYMVLMLSSDSGGSIVASYAAALDGALLAWAMRPGARRPERALLATLGVAPVVALDLAIWLNSRRSSAFLR